MMRLIRDQISRLDLVKRSSARVSDLCLVQSRNGLSSQYVGSSRKPGIDYCRGLDSLIAACSAAMMKPWKDAESTSVTGLLATVLLGRGKKAVLLFAAVDLLSPAALGEGLGVPVPATAQHPIDPATDLVLRGRS
jgi:hypothetical protein